MIKMTINAELLLNSMDREVALKKRVRTLFDLGMKNDILARNLAMTIAVYHAEHLAVSLRHDKEGAWQRLALCNRPNLLAETFLNLAPLFFLDGEDATRKRESVEYVLERVRRRAEEIGGTSAIIHQELEIVTSFILFGGLSQAEDRLTKLEEGLYARFDLELRWKRAAAEIAELLTEEDAE